MNNFVHERQPYITGPKSTPLNTVDVWASHGSPTSIGEKFWIVYIHGGAWRDPLVDSSSFEPALKVLSRSSLSPSIAGFASINYRLSPYPSHPNKPSSPDDPSRNVQHPAHVQDVAHALIYLEAKYKIDSRYLLAGHSAGGTLAFQLDDCYTQNKHIPTPLSVLGISGIYNFEAFLEAHSDVPVYKALMENAFPDRSLWEKACPYTNRLANHASWKRSKAIILSHSDEDELVEKAQANFMMERVLTNPAFADSVHFLPATGPHDGIWESGDILAGLIEKSLEILGVFALAEPSFS